MTKKVNWQDVEDLRKAIQMEIISLLKERNITELEFEFDEDSSLYTYALVWHRHMEAWLGKRVIAVGIYNNDSWYIRVYDDVDGNETIIYAEEMSLATNDIDCLLGIRDNIYETLNIK